MYGFPSDLDLNIFKGKILLQVCIGSNEVIMNFDSGISITVESSFRVHGPGSGSVRLEDVKSSAIELTQLISSPVVEASGQSDGTLRLKFAGDRVVEIVDSSTHYESYQIRTGEKLYVV